MDKALSERREVSSPFNETLDKQVTTFFWIIKLILYVGDEKG